jgi:type IV/VI secretion system ImpK/VasF family protein
VSAFRQHCRDALLGGADDARHLGYSAEDVRAATFAIVAYLDEAARSVDDARFTDWRQRTIEAELFHTQDAAEGFYRRLRELLRRPDGHAAADLIEVFQQCLLLGFQGMYGPATPDRRKLIEAADAKLRAARGPLGDLSPAWRAPQRLRARATAGSAASPPAAGPHSAAIEELARQAEAHLAFAGVGGGLRQAPALLVLGEPASVKTSTILHCGVAKQELAGEIYREGNVAPTAAANFWLARGAVVAEAGGALLSDASGWSRLLQLLGPCSGAPRAALVCIDAERIARAEHASRTARLLGARLAEYAQACGCRIPVYVIFTRLDKLPGCGEFVRKMSHDEASRAVGATLAEFTAPGDTPAALATRVKAAFDGVVRSLAFARAPLMLRETEADRVQLAYEFPRELHKLKGPVAATLSELCPPGAAAGAFLRGFYFSGARAIVVEENAPAPVSAPEPERVPLATGMFGADPPAPAPRQPAPAPRAAAPARRKIPQWLFLSSLFHEVLLRDFIEV